MNTISKLAFSNMRQNKGKNILTGIAIFLTTVLIFAITSIGFGMIDIESEAVKLVYPTFHAMYRNVNAETAENLSHRAEVNAMGLRQDPGQIPVEDGRCLMLYMDETAFALNRIELEKGRLPERKEEIVVSEGLLKELGLEASVGDTVTLPYQPEEEGGIGYEKKEDFVITGFLPTTEEQKDSKIFSALVSKDFMEQLQPVENRKYRVYIQIQSEDSMTTDEINEVFRSLAQEMGIPEAEIVENREYLGAMYVDPAFYTGVYGILFIVVFAGIMTIYSIYYIYMIYKVQEFGKIKALGATKRQIRQVVFREGMLTACIAIPLGLIAASIISVAGIQYLVSAFGIDDALGTMIKHLLKQKEVSILKPWIYLMTAGTAFFTVALSMIRPMKIAAKISPVEAMRYNGSIKTRKRVRKGHEDMNLVHLTGANLTRNKKRTAITITTLSLTGILFMVISTVLSCANPEEIARDAMFDDFRISVDSRSGDKMHPELEWSAICRNNPLTPELEDEILDIPGVKGIIKSSEVSAELKERMDGNEPWITSIIGIPKVYEDELRKSIVDGKCTYEEMFEGNKIVMDKKMLHWFPDMKIGDQVPMLITVGEEKLEKTYEIAAMADMPNGLSQYCSFLLPKAVLEEMGNYNLDYHWSVSADQKRTKEVESQLRTLAEEQEVLKVVTYEEKLEENRKNSNFTSQLCYVFMAVLGSIGIMNLINTMINSIYVRRRELGIMQALGLSERQMVHMLQMEGLFYTAGTMVVSLGLGNLLGYLAFLYAKNNGVLGIVGYHYPVMQTVVFVAIVLVIQMLLTYLIMKSFRKQSMMDRIRFSE